MRKFIFVSSALLLAGGIWSCDKIWSSSVVDCGGPGFKCPDGYTPPGPDMSMNETDGGNQGGDGGQGGNDGSATDMSTVTPTTYTSIYIMNNSQRLTWLGTGAGTIQSYSDVSNFPQKGISASEDPGSPIVGIWRGDVIDYMDGSRQRTLLVVASQNKKILSHINGQAAIVKNTTQQVNGLWVGAWNNPSVGVQGTTDGIRIMTVGNAGEFSSGIIDRTAQISWSAATNVGTQNLTSIAGYTNLTLYNEMMMCSIVPRPTNCLEPIVWAAGLGSSLFEYSYNEAMSTYVWNAVPPFMGLPTDAAFYAVGAATSTPRATAIGLAGVAVEREPPPTDIWKGFTPTPFAATIRSISYCDNYEAWAVGDGGAVYRWLATINGGNDSWTPVTVTVSGQGVTDVDFKAVHCAPYNGSVSQRVGIVGTKSTYVFNDLAMGSHTLGPWQKAQ